MTQTPQNEAAAGTAQPHDETIRDKAAHAYEVARTKAGEAVAASQEAARGAAERTAATVEGNPLGMLVGGIALGAIIAALIPRGERERTLLAPLGETIRAAALAAFAAAKDAGRSELDQLGINRDAARDQVRSLLDGVGKAARTAGTAAVQAGRDQVRGG